MKQLIFNISLVILIAATALIWHPRISVAQSEGDPPDFIPATPPTSPDAAPQENQIVSAALEGSDEGVSEGTEGGKNTRLLALPPSDGGSGVDISVEYGVGKVGHLIQASALDGGEIVTAPEDLVVDQDGFLTLQFIAGEDPGLYQVVLRDGAQETGVQFWVINERESEENPDYVPLPPGNQ